VRRKHHLIKTLLFVAIPLFPLIALGVANMLEAPAHPDSADCVAALARSPAARSEPMPQPLRLLSWNVMKFDIPGAMEQLDAFAKGAQLVLLQESLLGPATDTQAQPERYFSAGYSRGTQQTGVEIRSRQRADVSCSLSFREPWLRTRKAVSVARLPFRDQVLLVINLHAINFTLGSSNYRQQLESIGEITAHHEGPVIVAGDFNHWNFWRVSVVAEWARRFGLEEVSFDPDWRSRHLGSSLDTIFLRGLSPISATGLPTRRSDHHAILADLVTPGYARHLSVDNPAAASSPDSGP
jgi:endonuclease/exonuclease/phosphatase (EEP) superfamily protein YafD